MFLAQVPSKSEAKACLLTLGVHPREPARKQEKKPRRDTCKDEGVRCPFGHRTARVDGCFFLSHHLERDTQYELSCLKVIHGVGKKE